MRRVEMKKQYILGALIFVIALVTVGFALLQSSLSINGTVSTKSNSWNIYFDNIELNQTSVSKTLPTISNRTALSFNVELDKPGDLYEFSVDAVNDGSIDAMINNITATTLTEEQAKLIDLSYTYDDGASISSKDYLKASTRETIKVSVKYKEDITSTDLTNSNLSLLISIAIEYVQADETAKEREEISSKIWTAVTGDGTHVGDEIAVGEEHFYVISNDGTTLKALAQYNLYVGGTYNGSWAAYGSEATGLQDSNMRGWISGQDVTYGTTAFSSDSQKGTNYSDYTGSIVEGYVNSYKTKLNNDMNANIQSASLITKEELEGLGCSLSSTSCSGASSWLYSTSYWSGSTAGSIGVLFVSSDDYFNYGFYNSDADLGVRPVITILASEFE